MLPPMLICGSNAVNLFCKWQTFLHIFSLLLLELLKEMVETFVIPFSLVEKPRQYHEQEETPEMMAARIDREVVSVIVIFR